MCTPPSEQTGPSLGCEAIAGPVKGPTEQTGPGFSLEGCHSLLPSVHLCWPGPVSFPTSEIHVYTDNSSYFECVSFYWY